MSVYENDVFEIVEIQKKGKTIWMKYSNTKNRLILNTAFKSTRKKTKSILPLPNQLNLKFTFFDKYNSIQI